jgi:hypothetical protein
VFVVTHRYFGRRDVDSIGKTEAEIVGECEEIGATTKATQVCQLVMTLDEINLHPHGTMRVKRAMEADLGFQELNIHADDVRFCFVYGRNLCLGASVGEAHTNSVEVHKLSCKNEKLAANLHSAILRFYPRVGDASVLSSWSGVVLESPAPNESDVDNVTPKRKRGSMFANEDDVRELGAYVESPEYQSTDSLQEQIAADADKVRRMSARAAIDAFRQESSFAGDAQADAGGLGEYSASPEYQSTDSLAELEDSIVLGTGTYQVTPEYNGGAHDYRSEGEEGYTDVAPRDGEAGYGVIVPFANGMNSDGNEEDAHEVTNDDENEDEGIAPPRLAPTLTMTSSAFTAPQDDNDTLQEARLAPKLTMTSSAFTAHHAADGEDDNDTLSEARLAPKLTMTSSAFVAPPTKDDRDDDDDTLSEARIAPVLTMTSSAFAAPLAQSEVAPPPDVVDDEPTGDDHVDTVDITIEYDDSAERLGMGLKPNPKGGVRVMRVDKGSPADRCGRLFIDDRIMTVNGVDVSLAQPHTVGRLVSEAKGHLTLGIEVGSTNTLLPITLTTRSPPSFFTRSFAHTTHTRAGDLASLDLPLSLGSMLACSLTFSPSTRVLTRTLTRTTTHHPGDWC